MNFGGGHKCPRCDKAVYFAEEVIAIGQHWHKLCFICANKECNKRLNTGTCTEHEGEAYCTTCYKRCFGLRGYGYGLGAGTLSMDTSTSLDNSTETSLSTVSSSISSSSASSPLHSPGNHYYRQSSYLMPSPGGYRSNDNNTNSNPVRLSNTQNQYIINRQNSNGRMFGLGGEKCARCNKTVYSAERMVAAGKSWHRDGCFTCFHCNKRLESGSVCEKDANIFCKGCYAKSYGPKGYGYGIGAGTLQKGVF